MFFVYFGYQSFMNYVFCKDFPPVCDLSFNSLNNASTETLPEAPLVSDFLVVVFSRFFLLSASEVF